MRHVPQQNLRVATRGTTRAINRRIALNLIRTNQPISRADLARLMGTRRGAVSLLVGQLIDTGEVYEGATGEAKRGRKPTFLYIDSRKRCVVAVDIRTTRTFVMVTDLVGHQLASVTSFPTERDPGKFVAGLVKRVKAILVEHKDLGRCQGVGVVVPGMVDADAILKQRCEWEILPHFIDEEALDVRQIRMHWPEKIEAVLINFECIRHPPTVSRLVHENNYCAALL